MGQTTFSGPVVSQNGFIENSFTTAQRNAIVDPTAGLLIYNTTTNAYEVYNGTGWQDAFAPPAPPTVTYTANVDYSMMGGGVTANSQDPDPDTLRVQPGAWFNSNWNNIINTPVGTEFTIVISGISYTGTQTGNWVAGPGNYIAAMNWPVTFSSGSDVTSITF